MSYIVKTTLSNAYRCACCYCDSTREEKLTSKEEALERITRIFDEKAGYFEDLGKLYEIVKVIVIDAETDKQIAWAELDWPKIGPRGVGYTYYRWHGEIEGEKFEDIHGTNIKGKTWEEVCELLKPAQV